jgi:hypothetical protein
MNADENSSSEPRSSEWSVSAACSFMRKVIFRWVLFVALVVGCILGILNL